jgi:hypothetical protein
LLDFKNPKHFLDFLICSSPDCGIDVCEKCFPRKCDQVHIVRIWKVYTFPCSKLKNACWFVQFLNSAMPRDSYCIMSVSIHLEGHPYISYILYLIFVGIPYLPKYKMTCAHNFYFSGKYMYRACLTSCFILVNPHFSADELGKKFSSYMWVMLYHTSYVMGGRHIQYYTWFQASDMV